MNIEGCFTTNARMHVAVWCFASVTRACAARDSRQGKQVACRVVETDAFLDGMYQWASTLTSSGQNMPFALPLAADRTAEGFDISFISVVSGNIIRTSAISCVVEPINEVRPESLQCTAKRLSLTSTPGCLRQCLPAAELCLVSRVGRTEAQRQ